MRHSNERMTAGHASTFQPKKPKLKPCPFCGSPATLSEHGVWCSSGGNVEGVCNAHLCYPADGKLRVHADIVACIQRRSVEAWNRRQ